MYRGLFSQLASRHKKIDRFVEGVEKSSSLILPLCDEVFDEANILPKDLDGVLYTRGPGSFHWGEDVYSCSSGYLVCPQYTYSRTFNARSYRLWGK